MSAPPPAFPSQAAENPDRRPLPEGYITRYDERYSAWYYVDTRAQPPRSSWQHPHGPPPTPTSPQQSTNYPPPSNPPPNRNYNNSGSQPYSGQYSGTQRYNQPSPYQSGNEGGQPEQRNFSGSQQYPPQGYGYSGWQQQQGWQQPQQSPPQGYTQPPQRGAGFGRGGMGTAGTALLAGGGGLLAGALLTEVYEHHEERERDEAFEEGYMDAQIQDSEFGGW